MKTCSCLFLAALLSLPLSALAEESPKEDLKFLGVEKCKKNEFDCAWVDPAFSFRGKTIHVEKFEKRCEAPKGEDYGDLKWENADEYLQKVFENRTNERVKKYDVTFVTGGAGDYTLKGQITEFRYPKKAAAWGGWIGQAAGSGTVVHDWKIVDKTGKTVVAVHQKVLASASSTLDHRVNNVYTDEMVDFVKDHAK
jgi:hypothetical protein